MTPLERRCRLLLRAWPWRDRWERGEELLGTMLDISGEDRSWPSAGLAADMVVGGIRARRRRRPPLGVRIQYCTRARLDFRWHEWMLDQLLAPGWRRRLTFVNVRYVVTYMFVFQMMVVRPERPEALVGVLTVAMLALALIGGFVFAGWDRRRILRKNGYALLGSPPQLVSRLVWTEERARVANVRLAPAMAVVSLPLFLAGRALAVFLLSPLGRLDFPFHQPLVIALTAGPFLMTWGWTRVRRVPAAAPGSPTTWRWRPLPLVVVSLAIEVIFLLVWPMGPVGLAGGALGLVPAVATFVLVLEERRAGRSLGLWDAFPDLGPKTVARIGMPFWPDGRGWSAEGESRSVTG